MIYCFKYDFDLLESNKSILDWTKYQIYLHEYIRLPDCPRKTCWGNIFVIMGQTFDVDKYAQNHLKRS